MAKCVKYKATPSGRRCAKYSGTRKKAKKSATKTRKPRAKVRKAKKAKKARKTRKYTPKKRKCLRYKTTPSGRRCAKFAGSKTKKRGRKKGRKSRKSRAMGGFGETSAMNQLGHFGRLMYCGMGASGKIVCHGKQSGKRKPKDWFMVYIPKSGKRVSAQKRRGTTHAKNAMAQAADFCKGKKRKDFLSCMRTTLKKMHTKSKW